MTKHVEPRFPATLAEIVRLLGFSPSVLRAFPCQESSGALVDVGAGALSAGAVGTPQYRKPVKGIQEVGARARSGFVENWTVADAAIKPGAASWLAMYYGSFEGDGSNPNVGFGFLDNADGAQFILINPTDSTEALWTARARDDAGNSKSLTSTSSPRDGKARGVAFLYDAAAGLIYLTCSGEPVYTNAMGAWTTLGAGVTAPTIYIGGWPGVPGSDLTCRYGLLAHGAQLDNQGVNLGAIMRRFGWQ